VGSFVQCESFEYTPDAEISKVSILGEPVSERDITHDGYNFSFSCFEQGGTPSPAEVYQEIAAREEARQQPHNWTIVLTLRYRSPTQPARKITVESGVMKMDSHPVSGKAEYVKSTWSGGCKRVSVRKI
jgi:hypothetical protein